MNSISRILLVMAMHDEAESIIEALKLKPQKSDHPKLPVEIFSGTYCKKKVWLQLNGKCPNYNVHSIGTEASVLNTFIGIENFAPDLILNAGTAGGFASLNANIGDIYLSHPYVSHHDRRINIPGFKEYGIGKYPCYPCEHIAKKMGVKLGVISTGNSLDHTPTDLEILKSHNGAVKEMEAAAIAWIASIYGIPFLAIKAITDIVDGANPTEEEFLKNLAYSSKKLGEKTIELIKEL